MKAVAESNIIAYRAIDLTKTPVPKEKKVDLEIDLKEQKWIPFYSYANEFPILLATLLELSITHRACVVSKTNYSVGDGFTIDQDTSLFSSIVRKARKLLNLDTEVESLIKGFVGQANQQQSLGEIAEEAFMSWYGFGNVFMELERGQAGDKKYFYCYIHDPITCLLTTVKDPRKEKQYVIISPSFDEDYLRKNPPAKIPLYPFWERDSRGSERTIIHCKNKLPRRPNYGLPDGIASLIEQELEHEIPMHNKDGFDNGFFASALLTILAPNGMSKAAAKKLVNSITNAYTGKGNRKKMFVQVVKADNVKHELTTLNDKFDGDFLSLDQRVEKKIIRANNWFEILIGNPTAGKLGQVQEIINTFQLAYNTVILPNQNKILNKLINPALQEYFNWIGKDLKGFSLKISNSMPVSFAGSININEVTTINERREILGYEDFDDPAANELPKAKVKENVTNGTGNNKEVTN